MQTIRDGVMMVDRDGSILLMNDEAAACGSRAGTARRTTDRGHARVSRLFRTWPDDALRLLQDGKAVRLVNDVAPDGGIPLVEVSGTPTRNAEGEVAGAVWVLRDITHIARAEQERAKAAHLESLGVLAGGLARLQQHWTGVVGNLSLAQDLVRPEQQALRTRLSRQRPRLPALEGSQSAADVLQGGSPIKTTASIQELVVECTRFVLSGSPVAPRFVYPMARGRPMSTRTRSPRWCTISS